MLVNRFVVGPRPDLRLSSSTALVEDMERVTRKNEGNFTGMDWMPLGWVRLTNHGDGIAHDVKLTGQRCRPRVDRRFWRETIRWATGRGRIPTVEQHHRGNRTRRIRKRMRCRAP